MKNILIVIVAFSLTACSNKFPEIRLPMVISNHMVLQQENHANIWGWSNPGIIVKIETSWGESVNVRTGPNGKWRAAINTPKHGGPYTMTIKARKTVKLIEDIMVGEVWICSGQSNMEMPLKGWPPSDTILKSMEEISHADYPAIRMFTVSRQVALQPADSCFGTWEIASSQTVPEFSATAYFFGKKLHEELGIPVGLIHSSWGGTPAEAWTEGKYLEEVPGYQKIISEVEQLELQNKKFEKFLNNLKKHELNTSIADYNYHKLTYNDSTILAGETDLLQWNNIEVPGFWEDSVLPGFNGVVWLQKEFELPKNLYPEGFELYLGAIDDMDEVYVNNTKIGENLELGHYRDKRSYVIPSGILRDGVNEILVKIIDVSGGGGIYDESPAILKGAKRVVELSGEWKYLPSSVLYNGAFYLFGKGETSYAASPGGVSQITPYTPTTLFNGMIHPIIPYTIKGIVWYQGESNVGRAEQYKTLFPALIKCWREKFGENSFPFYYVQIAPFYYGDNADDRVAELREAQLETMKVMNTGMVVTMDIGNPDNIHPANKQEVGRRLALWALANNYDKEDIVCSGPIVSNVNFRNGEVEIKFDYAGNGLEIRDPQTTYFEIAGDDKFFYKVFPEVEDDKITVHMPDGQKPKFIRYAWGDDVEPNLFNAEGLPASPFRAEK